MVAMRGIGLTILMMAQVASGGEYGYESQADDIAKKLITPPPSTSGSGERSHRTRGGILGSAGQKGEAGQKRAIKVMAVDDKGQIVTKTTQVPIVRQEGFVNLKVEFDTGSSVIRKEFEPLLDQLGMALKKPELQGRAITINGHTDSDGDDLGNKHLSLQRAQAVVDYLVSHHGLESSHLNVAGYGVAMPVVQNDTPAHKQLNRRVEVVAE